MGLEGNKLKWENYKGNGECMFCSGEIEDVYHFIFSCKAFTELRHAFYIQLQKILSNFGDKSIMNQFHSGSMNFRFNVLFGNAFWEMKHDVGEAVSHLIKKYIKDIWGERTSMQNEI